MRNIIKIFGESSAFVLILAAGLLLGVNYVSADAGTGWTFTEPPVSSSADLTSLALNSNNYPGVAYIENNNLYYRECMSGDCTVATNWSSATLVADTSYELNNAVLHFNGNDEAVVVFKHNNNGETHFAHKITGGGGTCNNGTYNGSSDWNCAYPVFYRYGADYSIDFDVEPSPISGNDVYYIVGRTNSGTHKVGFVYCEEGSANYCDSTGSGQWNNYDLNSSSGVENSKVSADGNYVHVAYYEPESTNEIRYIACDKLSTNCDAAGDWTYNTDEVLAQQNTYYSPQLMDLVASNGNVGILFLMPSNSSIQPYSTQIQYLEYVGSGGNGSGSPWNGSASWNGTQVYGQNAGLWNASLDFSSVYGTMIAVKNVSNNTANLLTCSSNCEGSWDSDWTDTIVFDADDPNTYGYSIIGNDSRVVSASNGYPRFAFNGSTFYGQQDDEPDPPAEPEVPELPQNSIWKVLIAVLSLGLVIGVATFMKKKKK